MPRPETGYNSYQQVLLLFFISSKCQLAKMEGQILAFGFDLKDSETGGDLNAHFSNGKTS